MVWQVSGHNKILLRWNRRTVIIMIRLGTRLLILVLMVLIVTYVKKQSPRIRKAGDYLIRAGKVLIPTLLSAFALFSGVAAAVDWVDFTFLCKRWPVRYEFLFDDFFGEGNWSLVSTESKESVLFSDDGDEEDEDSPLVYENWEIQFRNRDGEEETYYVTNHVYKLYHSFFDIFKLNVFTAKQALTQQFMEISCDLVSEEVEEYLADSVPSKEEADCLDVGISYVGGNPKRKFYDHLRKEEWFNVKDASAERYLACDQHIFYIEVDIEYYAFRELPEEKQKHLIDSMDIFAEKLLQRYGDLATFEITAPAADGTWINIIYKNGKKAEDLF